ncbi:MAG: hypothetical protein P8171_14090 [Candidatus Thiodiazotropha sp.]
MMNTHSTITAEHARSKRQRLYHCIDFIGSNSKAYKEFGDSLNWNDCLEVPEWVYWDRSKINLLMDVCGTVFLLPIIRLWIDARKLSSIRELLGDTLFELILDRTPVNNNQRNLFQLNDVISSIHSSGSAVMIYSQSLRMRPWITGMLPTPKAKLEGDLAKQILKHSLEIISLSVSVTNQ